MKQRFSDGSMNSAQMHRYLIGCPFESRFVEGRAGLSDAWGSVEPLSWTQETRNMYPEAYRHTIDNHKISKAIPVTGCGGLL
jgi:hypothetical protein